MTGLQTGWAVACTPWTNTRSAAVKTDASAEVDEEYCRCVARLSGPVKAHISRSADLFNMLKLHFLASAGLRRLGSRINRGDELLLAKHRFSILP
jgi:hypothetical protein